MKTRFEWDPAKAKSNIKKHGVNFEIATRVFVDPFAQARQDRTENGECRLQTLGVVNGYLLLVIAHTVREDEEGTEVIRIISARRAEPKERKRYEENSPLRG
ncbi:BrnT family toxin [Desulfovibrio sp. OttesenSCG-928-O18]|nr:BrnT family toxin [Desulfovibrio sp. OttesenSCG-928-O18]